MSNNIEKTLEQIDELPDTDDVHCYDYEIRTDDLKVLTASYREMAKTVERYERMHKALIKFDFVVGSDVYECVYDNKDECFVRFWYGDECGDVSKFHTALATFEAMGYESWKVTDRRYL